ncbi:MAG: hypothetical protein ACTSSQ_00495 [Alphaproteobacteria bacterium]
MAGPNTSLRNQDGSINIQAAMEAGRDARSRTFHDFLGRWKRTAGPSAYDKRHGDNAHAKYYSAL